MSSVGQSQDTSDDTLLQDSDGQERAIELSLPFDESPGDVPGYTILHSLGKGAYGSVWLARENNTGKKVAIKFYTHKRGLDWSLLNREVERLAVLYTSRNIVRLLGVGWDSDPPYYIMEHLENGSLASLLADGPIPVHEAVRIVKTVAQALVHAHGSGILHCDLKPANVLLDADYEPRLCDFGQSRLSDEQNPALGTLFYMAPEQADLDAVPDARWDVYALGALLYQMLTGTAPYRSPEAEKRVRETESLSDRLAAYRKILKTSPSPTAHRKMFGVDKRLAEIIDRCLRLNPEKRFPNAQAVLGALHQRDRFRSRRPLIGLGIVGPAFLLFALMPYFASEMSNAVGTLRSQLTNRALESNVLPAELLASNVKHDLENRRTELENVSRNPALIDAVVESQRLVDKEQTDWALREQAFSKLKVIKRKIDDERTKLGREPDQSWFVTNARGRQIWRDPPSFDDDDENPSDLKVFNYRDYFNGRGQDFPKSEIPKDIKPIESPHISVAFISTSTSRVIVGVSVPIRALKYKEVSVKKEDEEGQETETTETVLDLDEEGQPQYGNVIGVLARTIELNHLLGEHGRHLLDNSDSASQSTNRVERNIALIQCRDGMLLDHPWLDDPFDNWLKSNWNWKNRSIAEKRPILQNVFTRLHVSEETANLLKKWDDRDLPSSSKSERKSLFIEDYRDPIGKSDSENKFEFAPDQYGGTWLAALAHVPGTGWATVVQERKDTAMKSVEELRSRTMRSGIIALLIGCSLIGLLWYFVARALNERTFNLGSIHRHKSRSGGSLSTTSSSTHSDSSQ